MFTMPILLAVLPGARPTVTGTMPPAGLCADGDADMSREIRAWYRAHPEHGTGTAAGSAADTFFVGSFWFNTDGSLATQIDTARVSVGESVLFKWSAGFHTATSGNPGDLDAGSLFDHAVDSGAANQEFTVTYPTAGTFPFHCRPHGQFFSMRGVVVVTNSTTDARGTTPSALHFAAPPTPNPGRGPVALHLAMPRDGDVRVELFDAMGRRVAVLHDGPLGAGARTLTWDGRLGGRAAPAGTYLVRARAGVDHATQRVVVAR